MTKRSIYISGPMRGIEAHNYPLFHRVANELRGLGHEVFNPAEYWDGDVAAFPLRRAMADFAAWICGEADALVLLPGWQQSAGAQAEHALARAIGLDCWEYHDFAKRAEA